MTENYIVTIVAYDYITDNTQVYTLLFYAHSLAEAKGLALDRMKVDCPFHNNIKFCDGFNINKSDLC